MPPACGCLFFYLSLGLVCLCEIEFSHMGRNNGNPNLVCENKISNEDVLQSLKIVFTLANSVDPDEMPQNVAFHLGLHCWQIYSFNEGLINSFLASGNSLQTVWTQIRSYKTSGLI